MAPTFFPKPVIMRWLKALSPLAVEEEERVTLWPSLLKTHYSSCPSLIAFFCALQCVPGLVFCPIVVCFKRGKHKAWLAANSGGASLSLSAQWNLCRGTRKVFVGERFSFCCERFSRQLLLCRNHLLLFSTLLLLLCLSSLDDDSVARGQGRGGFTVEGGQTGGKRQADPASFSFSLHPFFFIALTNCSSFFLNNIFRFSFQIATLSLPVLSFSILYISPAPPALL